MIGGARGRWVASLDTRLLGISDELLIDGSLFVQAKLLASCSELLESLSRIELDILLQLLVADRAEQLDATSTLLISAHDTVHEALVVDAVSQTELVTDLMAHDVAGMHQQGLLTVRVLDTVPGWIIARKRDAAHATIVGSPAEAEGP